MPVDAAAEEQFGPYLVYERLGVGGMATVHRALEQGAEGFERMVALKRLLPHLAEDASFIKSFVREAKLASLLNHLNIVQIYELGRVGTEYFISMEYIDGRDLRRILRHARKVTGPPPINITVGLMIQLCDALDYAHNKVDEDGHPLGLVHRDISPSNLIVTSGGHLKIIDFGIAKAQSSQLRTHTGRVKGKLAYMAPEAVSGSRDLDARSDIWACGVILHELLTARPLFASKNEYQTLLKVQRGDIMPPSTFNHACPPELDAIVFRALARDADQRFASAAELRDALIKLKVQQAMHSGSREIASWLDWAFGLEPPASFSTSPDSSGVSSPDTPKNARHKTPRPARNTEEDEAVEVVWGGGNVESEDGPVVLEDVPDVSEKHQRPKRDSENEPFDNVPTPPPTQGTMPSIYGSDQIVVVPQHADSSGRVVEPMRTHRPTSPHTIPRRATGVHQAVRSGDTPPPGRPGETPLPGRPGETPLPGRPARATSQGVPAAPRSQSDRMRAQSPSHRTGPVQTLDTPQLSDRMAAQRARDTGAPINEPRARTETGAPIREPRARTESGAPSREPRARTESGAPSHEPRTRTESGAPINEPRGRTESGVHAPEVHRARTAPGVPANPDVHRARTVHANPEVHRARTEPGQPDPALLFGADAESALARVGTMSDDGAQDDDEPTLEPSTTPVSALPNVPVVRFAKSQTAPPPTTPIAEPSRPQPSTKQGVAPVRAHAAPRAHTVSKAPSNIRIGDSIAARSKPGRTWVLALGGLLLVGGIAAAVVMATARGKDTQATREPAPPPVRDTGTVRFVLEPPDAEIKIAGTPAHTGSPWSSELAAGTHQIEIHRQGYKSWLTSIELSPNETQTLRVVLEPLGATVADATLTIATTPAGLEVLIDGQVHAQRTPVKTTLKPGAHKIAVRQNGVEVWHQSLNAEPSSDYEFNPSFTEDKQRERAQRTPTRPAPLPVPDKQEINAEKLGGTSPTAPAPSPTAPRTTTPAITQPAPPPQPAPPATAAPSPTASTTAPAPKQTPPAPAPRQTPPPAPPKQQITAPARPAGVAPAPTKRPATPPIVPPVAVKKLAGDPPSIAKYKNMELPAAVAAKLCIDQTGKVTSADMMTKLDRRVANDITGELRGWRYAPYKLNGTPSPACFVVSLRTK